MPNINLIAHFDKGRMLFSEACIRPFPDRPAGCGIEQRENFRH